MTLSLSSRANSPTQVFLPRERFVGELHAQVVAPDRCTQLIDDLTARGFAPTGEHYPADYRNNDRLVFDDPALAADLFDLLRERLPAELVEDGARWELVGLNVRFRACRYANGQAFCIHRDGAHVPSEELRSFLTVQLYLDDDPARSGGRTRFYADPQGREPWAAIAPARGSVIVFDHRVWHDGEGVHAGIKHVLRTDAMYRRVDDVAHSDEPEVIGRHRGYAWAAILCRDGSIASAGRDGTIRRWISPAHVDAGSVAARSTHVGAGSSAATLTPRSSAASSTHVGAGSSAASSTHVGAGSSTSLVIDLRLGSVTALVAACDGTLWCGTRAGSIARLAETSFSRTSPPGAATHHDVSSGDGAILGAAVVDDLIAFSTSRGTIVAFHLNGSLAWRIDAHVGWAWNLTRDGEHLLSCGHDGRVLRIDRAGKARLVATLSHPLRTIAGGDGIDVGDERGWIHSLARDGSVLRSRRAHVGAVTALARTHDGALLSAGEDGAVIRWNGAHATVLLRLRDHVTSVVVDGEHAITTGYDGAVRRIALG